MSKTNPLATKTEERQARSKAQFLESLKLKFGNATEAAKAIGITRQAAYLWRRDDAAFAAEWESLNESLKDFAESKLHIAIGRGQAWAICFFLKCRAKDRGYVERQEISHSGKFSLEDVLAESWKGGGGKKPDGAA